MMIRRAINTDIAELGRLLLQVAAVHQQGRPDLFKAGERKYSDAELAELLADPSRPIFVALEHETSPQILGYAFCVEQEPATGGVLQPIRTLYIDDICVDEKSRGAKVGSALYEHVLTYAREQGFYNITLNVWECNPGARAFYESLGLVAYKTGMEQIL